MFSKDEFRHAVIEGLKRVRGIGEVTLRDEQDFGDIGLDSLEGMNLVLEVETLLGITLGEFDLRGSNSIDAFYVAAVAAVSKQGTSG